MTKHTAGPWSLSTSHGAYQLVFGQKHRYVATLRTRDTEESSANARLIAAAPELLGALYAVKHAFEGVQDRTDEAAIQDAYKRTCWVIAKAEGRDG